MATVHETTGEYALSIAETLMLQRAAYLLVGDTRTVRTNFGGGIKFPSVELSVSTPDYDQEQGTGLRARYYGAIDRATRDAVSPDPRFALESASERVDVPVVKGLPMMLDGTRIKAMPAERQHLAARLAGELLAGLEVVPTDQ